MIILTVLFKINDVTKKSLQWYLEVTFCVLYVNFLITQS
jgi:hypothetical protein